MAVSSVATSTSPIGTIIMILLLFVIPGLIVMFILLGKRKSAGRHAVEPANAEKPAAAPVVNENIDAIEKLAELHRKGILTDEEFSQKKKTLLDKL